MSDNDESISEECDFETRALDFHDSYPKKLGGFWKMAIASVRAQEHHQTRPEGSHKKKYVAEKKSKNM